MERRFYAKRQSTSPYSPFRLVKTLQPHTQAPPLPPPTSPLLRKQNETPKIEILQEWSAFWQNCSLVFLGSKASKASTTRRSTSLQQRLKCRRLLRFHPHSVFISTRSWNTRHSSRGRLGTSDDRSQFITNTSHIIRRTGKLIKIESKNMIWSLKFDTEIAQI